MYKEHEVKKIYYSIGEVSEILSVPNSLIRYYQKEFQISCRRTKGNLRMFSDGEIVLLMKAVILAKAGFSIQLVKKLLKMDKHKMKEFFNELIYKVEL